MKSYLRFPGQHELGCFHQVRLKSPSPRHWLIGYARGYIGGCHSRHYTSGYTGGYHTKEYIKVYTRRICQSAKSYTGEFTRAYVGGCNRINQRVSCQRVRRREYRKVSQVCLRPPLRVLINSRRKLLYIRVAVVDPQRGKFCVWPLPMEQQHPESHIHLSAHPHHISLYL